MELVNTENTNKPRELSEKELDALYLYLDMYMDTMSDEDITYWLEILTHIDKEFYDNTGDGVIDLQNVSSSEAGT